MQGDTVKLLFSDYETAGFDNTDTIFTHLAAANTGGTTTFSQGVPSITGANETDLAAAAAAVSAADVTVLAIGLDKSQEHEGMDRKDTLLPANQAALAAKVFAAAR